MMGAVVYVEFKDLTKIKGEDGQSFSTVKEIFEVNQKFQFSKGESLALWRVSTSNEVLAAKRDACSQLHTGYKDKGRAYFFYSKERAKRGYLESDKLPRNDFESDDFRSPLSYWVDDCKAVDVATNDEITTG